MNTISSRAFVGGSVEVLRTFPRTKELHNTGFTKAYTCRNVTKVDHSRSARKAQHASQRNSSITA